MIYMEPSSLGWRPLFKSWMNHLPETMTDMHKKIIQDMFERFVDACLSLVRKKAKVRTCCIVMWTVIILRCILFRRGHPSVGVNMSIDPAPGTWLITKHLISPGCPGPV